jgi:hypothetical protein
MSRLETGLLLAAVLLWAFIVVVMIRDTHARSWRTEERPPEGRSLDYRMHSP